MVGLLLLLLPPPLPGSARTLEKKCNVKQTKNGKLALCLILCASLAMELAAAAAVTATASSPPPEGHCF